MIMRIAIVSIAISLSVMIITTALITGFKHQITEKIFGFWGHMHITDSNISLTREPRPIDMSQAFYEELQDVGAVEYQTPVEVLGYEIEGQYNLNSTTGGIQHVHSFAMAPAILSTKNEFEGIVIKGIGPDYDWDRMNPFLKSGSELSGLASDSIPSKGLFVSQKTADRLKLEIDQKIIVHFIRDGKELKRAMKISGIYNTGLGEYDKKFALADIRYVQEVFGWEKNQVGGLEVFVDDLEDLDIMTEYVYYNVLPSNLYAENIRDKFPNIFEWLGLQDINEVVILSLMVVVSIINMITALLILIRERSKMVGTLKALGATNWSVRKIFLYHAMYIISRGLFWGTFIGVLVCLIQKYSGIITLDESNYYLSVAPIQLDFLTVLLINLGTLILTMIFLILPTFIITRIEPIRVLRFE